MADLGDDFKAVDTSRKSADMDFGGEDGGIAEFLRKARENPWGDDWGNAAPKAKLAPAALVRALVKLLEMVAQRPCKAHAYKLVQRSFVGKLRFKLFYGFNRRAFFLL